MLEIKTQSSFMITVGTTNRQPIFLLPFYSCTRICVQFCQIPIIGTAWKLAFNTRENGGSQVDFFFYRKVIHSATKVVKFPV